jgi:hypothetical protein
MTDLQSGQAGAAGTLKQRSEPQFAPDHNRAVALSLAKAGYPVFPVRDWSGKGRLTPIKGWPDKASVAANQVASWWDHWPEPASAC